MQITLKEAYGIGGKEKYRIGYRTVKVPEVEKGLECDGTKR